MKGSRKGWLEPKVLYIYLVCGLHIKPKFKAFLPAPYGFAELVEHNTPHPPPNNNSKQYNRQQVCKSSFKRQDVIKIKNRSALRERAQSTRGRIPGMYSMHETSFYIVIQTFAVDLDFAAR